MFLSVSHSLLSFFTTDAPLPSPTGLTVSTARSAKLGLWRMDLYMMNCELLATCSALGYLEGGTYHKEPDCLGEKSFEGSREKKKKKPHQVEVW